MRPIMFLPIVAMLAASPALAQSAADPMVPPKPAPEVTPVPLPQADAPVPKSDAMPPKVEANAPLPGANSFTESQAKTRIEGTGISGVSSLAKDQDGIWRGTGTKDGKPVAVAVDFKGNVVAK